MKKRIVCALLTLIMLVSLVPVTASAATLKTSEAAITVLKQLTTFEGTCKPFSGKEFRIGYGTVCTQKHHFDTNGKPVVYSEGETDKNKHTITEKQADTALREYLPELEKKINSFASSNGLTLSQNQFDALVIFTFGEGDAWLNGTGVLKDAVVKGADVNTLLNAMSLWGNMNRRKVEANMYVNGIYSNTIPSSFKSVTYHANGGTISQGNGDTYTMQFDSSKAIDHIKATNGGKIFLGWYNAQTNGKRMPKLNGDCKDLYAYWQDGYGAGAKAVSVSYTVKTSDLVSTTMYEAPIAKPVAMKDAKNNTLKITKEAQVEKDYISEDGTRWARVYNPDAKVSGWVKVGTPKSVTSDGTMVDFEVTVTVTNSYVNRRVNATASSAKNGSYSQGTQLLIIREDGGWGQVGVKDANGIVEPVGWVALMYTNWNEVKDGAVSGSSNNKVAIATATVTFNGYLNVRNEAGTDGKIVGALAKNDTVNIYEIKTVNGHQWGRSDSGWLCLTYTKITMLTDSAISDAGALEYAFTGKVVNGNITAHVEAGDFTDYAQYKDADGKMQNLVIKKDKAVTLTNLVVVNEETWAKATWKNDEQKKSSDGKYTDITVTRTGWVKISNAIAAYSGEAAPQVKLDPVKYTVVSDTINARFGAGDGENLVFTLNKGTEVEVNKIVLLNENIWGMITVVNPVESGKTGVTGWINLASKYVKRSSQVTIDKDENKDTGLIATVINTDSLRVRKTGATYGAVIGSLSRGTTVAVWEKSEKGWYKVDSNQNGTYDYDSDGWASGAYLDVRAGSMDEDKTVTDSNGNSYTTDGTGKGIVANTYSGVNVRTGAGTANAVVGKLLPGTAVDILETKTVGASKWGRTDKGWVCMDYITMVTYNPSATPDDPNKGTGVGSLDDLEKTTTTAVYTGVVNNIAVPLDTDGSTVDGYPIYKEADTSSTIVRTAKAGENLTIHELAKVTKTVKSDPTTDDDKSSVTTVKTTTYWARVNDGWIQNPAQALTLNALDEKVHTLTGSDTLNIRKEHTQDSASLGKLQKGDQVTVTALEIENDKVWGRIETEKGTGWIRLDYMTEGAYYVKETPTTPVTPAGPDLGNTGNTGSGGFVTNSGGYKYTGKVINTSELNVRATASTNASKTTTLKNGAALVIYETTIAENMAWGRCDAGWVYLYYVDLTPCVNGAVDARVVYNDNTVVYTDVNCSSVAGTYARMSVVDIYEIVGKMARTELGWVNTDNLL